MMVVDPKPLFYFGGSNELSLMKLLLGSDMISVPTKNNIIHRLNHCHRHALGLILTLVLFRDVSFHDSIEFTSYHDAEEFSSGLKRTKLA